MKRTQGLLRAREEAPGVSRILQRTFPDTTRQHSLTERLSRALEAQREHRWVERETGVSFNPLPARLLEILIREGRETSIESLETALSFFPISDKNPVAPLTTWASSGTPGKASDAERAAHQAFALDLIRHLHRKREGALLVRESREEEELSLLVATVLTPPQECSRLEELLRAAIHRTFPSAISQEVE
ncbi:hypothetical protein MRY87_12530 [bacterium]|nr:hypothetical protein [bacterium]